MQIEYWTVAASFLALIYAAVLAYKIKKRKIESKKAEEIAGHIHEGAMAFLNREYKILSIFVVLVSLILWFAPGLGIRSAVSFLVGSIFSMLAGNIGMRIATRANVRTAEAVRKSISSGLDISFSAGSVMSFSVVGLGLLGITTLFILFNDPNIIFAFGFGASSVALFARVGGGIYTKAADVGADLVGKIEADIPEDDPRNPAVIADNVGDNVGDVAGMGADLFESFVDSIVAVMALALGVEFIFGANAIMLPLLLGALGIVAAILGNLVIKFKKNKNIYTTLNIGIWTTAIIMIVFSYFATRYTISSEQVWGVFASILVGLMSGVIIGLATEFYTSDKNKQTQHVAKASKTGAATNIIAGFSLGLMSTVIPVLTVAVAIFLSYKFAGLFGIAISAVGMLSTLGITLATDAYGPVADNAAGIAQMAEFGPEARGRAEQLDAIGNTTAATGKGFAIGSAALTALILLISYGKAVGLESVNLMSPIVIIGLFIGGLLPVVFSALSMKAVGDAAGKMVEEVRRQFREIPGIMDGTAQPDYKRAIKISTDAALVKMIAPGLLAVVSPVLVGIFLGIEALAGLLAGAIVVGFLLAIVMANAGGAWDNAKKYIEAGNLGGKGSDAHKAAVVGDTVGDPFKDTSGPSLNILIKLMSIVSIVIAPLLLL